MTKIHRFWIGPPSSDEVWISKVVQLAHPGVEIMNWTMETLSPNILDRMNPDDDPGHLSNIVRHWALYEYGGLWLDHDVIPLRNLTRNSKPWTAALGRHREGSVMWFPKPGHPMMKEMLEIAVNSTPDRTAPGRSGTLKLRESAKGYDVGFEERVLPIDALGRRTETIDVWAVHLWRSTTIRRAQK